jgi:hypothetical protein
MANPIHVLEALKRVYEKKARTNTIEALSLETSAIKNPKLKSVNAKVILMI